MQNMMMSANSISRVSIRQRMMRPIVIVIMGISFLFGLIGFITVQTNVRANVRSDHARNLTLLSEQLQLSLASAVEDVRALAALDVTRQFAFGSMMEIGRANTNNAQDALIAAFEQVINAHPTEYAAIRYVTFTGAEWTEITNNDGILSIDPRVRFNTQNDDPALTEALGTAFGDVVTSGINFSVNPDASATDRLVAFLRVASPVYIEVGTSSIAGVVQIDVLINPIFTNIQISGQSIAAEQPGRSLIVTDDNNNILYDSSADDINYLRNLSNRVPLTLQDRYPAIAESLDVQRERDNAFAPLLEAGGLLYTTYHLELAPNSTHAWHLILVDSSGVSTPFLLAVGVLIFAICLGAGALISFAINEILKRNFRPVETLHEAALTMLRDANSGTLPQTISPPTNGQGDEITTLMAAFNTLAERANKLTIDVEDQRTRYARNLDIARRISRETAALRDTDSLLNRAINAICDEFNYYHAQVFRIDDAGMNAVLIYSRGEIGAQLLQRGYRIPVGSDSIIGKVAATGRAITLNDVTVPNPETPFMAEPLLPETRAEMVLPLQIGDRILGALDIQSRQPNSFNPDDVRTLQILADQIAVALENARLLVESEERIREIDMLNRQLTNVGWDEVDGRESVPTVYRYNLVELQRVVEDKPAEDYNLSIPIRIRGEVVGTLNAAAPEGMEFTEGDESIVRAIADRVGIAVENARLFETTQSTLNETSTLYQLVRALNEAITLEDVLNSVITSVMPDAVSAQIGVFDDYNPSTGPVWLEILADWTATNEAERSIDMTGLQLHVPEHTILQEIKPNQVALVNDISRDRRLDEVFRAIVQSSGGQSMVMIPFVVRGHWRGLIMVEFPEPRQFSQREGRIYSAITDQAGVVIDNRLLLRQNQAALDQVERLYGSSRSINMSQKPIDLVNAAMTGDDDPDRSYVLALFEGALDSTGWPTRIRIAAYSHRGTSHESDEVFDISISPDSPLRYREPQIIIVRGDEDQSSLTRFVRNRGYRFAAAFPLFSINQPMALFFVASDELREELSNEDYEVYRALTGQMSTVLQNRRLLDQTAQTLDETQRLYAASRTIASALDSQSVYDAAARYLVTPLTPLNRMSVLLANVNAPTAEFIEYKFIHEWQRDRKSPIIVGTRVLFGDIPIRAALADKTSLALNHAQDFADNNLSALKTHIAHNGSTSAAIISLQSRARWLGVVLCESADENVFDPQYLTYAQAVVDQVAIAIEALQSFEEARIQAQRSLALAEAGQLANQISSEFEYSLARVFQRVAESADYDRWILMLYNEQRNGLMRVVEYEPGRGLVDLEDEGQALPLDMQGIALLDAYNLNRPLLVNDPRSYPNFPAQFAGLADFAAYVGKHLAVPVRIGDKPVGALALGRSLEAQDLDDNDERLAATLSTQVAVALENRRLFQRAESERENLRSILETLPAGVLVLDAATYKPIQFNQQAVNLLGRDIDNTQPFDTAAYNLYKSGTNALYPDDALPIFAALNNKRMVASDDVVIHQQDYQASLLVNAAPITDARGNVSAIVAAFQDITTLRQLEAEVAETLRETEALYAATRSLAESRDMDDLLDQIMLRLSFLEPKPDNAFILLLEEETGVRVARAAANPSDGYEIPDDMLRATAPVFAADVSAAPNIETPARSALLMKNIHSIASLPLLARSRAEAPLGWLVVTYNRPTTIIDERRQYLNALADASSVAIDNRNLFRETQAALNDANDLYTATTMISRVNTQEELGAALQRSLETLKPDVYAGYLFTTSELDAGETSNEFAELFNENLDDAPIPFSRILDRHGIIVDSAIYIDDLRALTNPTPFEKDLIDLGSIRSIAIVQIRLQEQPAGVLIVGFHRPRHFSQSITRYLGAISESASVIVSNLSLLDQISANLNETRILYQASRALNDSKTPEDIVQVATTHLFTRPISLAFVGMLSSREWSSPGATMRVVTSWHAPDEEVVDLNGITLNAEQFPAWRLLASQQVLMIDDVQDNDSLDMLEQAGIESIGLRSVVFIPLRAGGDPIGVLVIGSRNPYRHTVRDERIFRAFSEQASLRLEASRLLAQTERRARQLATSSEVSQAASSILDLNYLLPRIVDLIRDTFQYDHVQIFLMDEQEEYAVLRASTGEAGRQLLSINHKLQKGSASVIGQVTSTAKPAIASDTADARVVHRPNPYLPNTRSEMAIPLVLQDRVVGALDVQSNLPNAFDDDDLNVLTTLAAQISVAIDNARLYEDAQRRANETSFLFNVTSRAAGSETLEDALRNVAEELRQDLNALTAGIYLPRQYIEGDDEENVVTMLQPMALAGTDIPLTELTEIRLDAPDNLVAFAASTRRAFILSNLLEEGRYFPIATDARSAIIVPLVAGVQLVGLITAESALPNAYDNQTLTLLMTLAGTLSAIVQNQQLLEQVQRQNDALRELDRLKSDFLANMSHELRTPLNSIIGFSRVILKGIDGPLTEMQEQDLSTIYNSGLHLLNLINDILDQAKIAAGKMDLQFDYFEIKGVIDGVRSIGIGLVKDKPIDIQVNLASGLPKAYGDEFRTRQVLLNLVSNAAKFTRQGSITINVYTFRNPDVGETFLRVDVTDTGIGIAEKDLPLLFEAFRQVDSSLTRTQGGTGLGLPIAKSLVEMQGGEMLVESEINVGSTFSITIPTQPTIQLEGEQSTVSKPGSGKLAKTAPLTPPESMRGDDTEERPALKPVEADITPARPPMHIKRQILVIEDNPDMVDQFRRILQREGFDIFAASIPLEAEAMASGLHPTLIVMDVNFANGQGWDMLERLKNRDDTRDIPIVVVSLSDEEERGKAAGVFTWLRRPFMPEQLTEAVMKAEEESRIDRILIVDDQPESVRVLQDLLTEQGNYKVFTAGSAMDGISMVARRRPDLVIVDLRMPEMDGFQLISELRSNPETATIPIIVVTGDTLNPEERKQLNNLAVLYKADINAGQRGQFIEGVKTHLTKNNGSGTP